MYRKRKAFLLKIKEISLDKTLKNSILEATRHHLTKTKAFLKTSYKYYFKLLPHL